MRHCFINYDIIIAQFVEQLKHTIGRKQKKMTMTELWLKRYMFFL